MATEQGSVTKFVSSVFLPETMKHMTAVLKAEHPDCQVERLYLGGNMFMQIMNNEEVWSTFLVFEDATTLGKVCSFSDIEVWMDEFKHPLLKFIPRDQAVLVAKSPNGKFVSVAATLK